MVVIKPELSNALALHKQVVNSIAHIRHKEVLTNKQSFKFRELGHGTENTVTFVSNLVVLNAKDFKLSFVLKHVEEFSDRFVLDVVVVKVKLLQRFVVYKCLTKTGQTEIANEITFQAQFLQAEQRVLARTRELSGAPVADIIIRKTESFEINFVFEHTSNNFGSLAVDLVAV